MTVVAGPGRPQLLRANTVMVYVEPSQKSEGRRKKLSLRLATNRLSTLVDLTFTTNVSINTSFWSCYNQENPMMRCIMQDALTKQ